MNVITHPLDVALAAVSEFPERLGPVLIKELRQGLRSGLFVLPFVVLPAVLGIVAVWGLAVDNSASARSGVGGFFWVAVVVPVLVITPLRALGAVRSEREAQTLDLLQLTPLTAWRIVFAKWSSLVVQALLWVVALLPFFVLRYFFGGMNLTGELASLLWVLTFGAALTAAGIVVSTLPRLLSWLTLAAFVVFGFGGFWSILLTVFSGRSYARSLITGAAAGFPEAALLIGIVAHLTYLALAYAASRIAPLADNYALRLRGGALALFAWPVLGRLLLGDRDEAWGPFFFLAVSATTVITVIDLAASRTPLRTHVRPWARFGRVGLPLGRAFMPGWPGAVGFFSGATVLATAFLLLVVPQESGTTIAMTPLYWTAVMLPRALQCLFAPRGGERLGLHVLLHLVGGLFASLLAAFSFALHDLMVFPAALFPSAMFWLTLSQVIKVESHYPAVVVCGGGWTLLLAIVFWYHSRAYWSVMAEHAATLRSDAPASTTAPAAS
jgi:ABC-type transport system involved in multi-copper enzyme maturation permease subunit